MSDDCNDYEGSSNNTPTPVWLHVLGTIASVMVFCLAIQQLLGSPTSDKKIKVFKYRSMVVLLTFTSLIMAITLNFEQRQSEIEEEGKSNDIVDKDFVKVCIFLMVLYVAESLVTGYWFLIDAVGAAYKATNGINQAQAPPWIGKFWLVVIVIEESILVLCFIFAFAMTNTIFLSFLWLSGFGVAAIGAGIVLACVLSVYKSINAAIQNGNDAQINTLRKARRTLTLMAGSGLVFGSLSLIAFIFVLGSIISRAMSDACLFNRNNLKSTLLDNPWLYIRYMLVVIFFNVCLMLWTYRSSNINYCCFCWTYKKYTDANHREEIDESVVCYKCFPNLIDKAEEQRKAIMEDSEFNGTNESPNI